MTTSCFIAFQAILHIAAAEPMLAACPPCSLGLDTLVTLSSEAVDGAPSSTVSVARLGDDQYAVVYYFTILTPQVFREDGTFLRPLGGTGRGPGEFSESPTLFVGPGGDLHATTRDRIVRFDSNATHASTVTHDMAVVTRLAAVGKLLVSGRIVETRRGQMHIVELRDTALTVVRELELSSETPLAVLEPLGDSAILVLDVNNSSLRRHWLADRRSDTIRIAREWFKPWTDPVPGEGHAERPRPKAVALSTLTRDRVVVATWVADDEWAPATVAPGVIRFDNMDHSRIWDTIFEVVDIATGQVLGSIRVDGALRPVQGAQNRWYATRVTDDGHVAIDIMQLAGAVGPS
jgi:hypothetical protein